MHVYVWLSPFAVHDNLGSPGYRLLGPSVMGRGLKRGVFFFVFFLLKLFILYWGITD